MENSEEIPLLRLLPIMQWIVCTADAHKKFGVTKSQMIIFFVLYYRDSVTMSEIARYISSSKEQATRTVAALCDSGLVERYEDSGNRTLVLIRFTDKGRETMHELLLWLRSNVAEKLSASLSEEELARLHQSVQTTVELLSKVK